MYNTGNIPGFDILLEMTETVDVQLTGNCPTIAASWITETRKEVEAKEAARQLKLKRKRTTRAGVRKTKAKKTGGT